MQWIYPCLEMPGRYVLGTGPIGPITVFSVATVWTVAEESLVELIRSARPAQTYDRRIVPGQELEVTICQLGSLTRHHANWSAGSALGAAFGASGPHRCSPAANVLYGVDHPVFHRHQAMGLVCDPSPVNQSSCIRNALYLPFYLYPAPPKSSGGTIHLIRIIVPKRRPTGLVLLLEHREPLWREISARGRPILHRGRVDRWADVDIEDIDGEADGDVRGGDVRYRENLSACVRTRRQSTVRALRGAMARLQPSTHAAFDRRYRHDHVGLLV